MAFSATTIQSASRLHSPVGGGFPGRIGPIRPIRPMVFARQPVALTGWGWFSRENRSYTTHKTYGFRPPTGGPHRLEVVFQLRGGHPTGGETVRGTVYLAECTTPDPRIRPTGFVSDRWRRRDHLATGRHLWDRAGAGCRARPTASSCRRNCGEIVRLRPWLCTGFSSARRRHCGYLEDSSTDTVERIGRGRNLTYLSGARGAGWQSELPSSQDVLVRRSERV